MDLVEFLLARIADAEEVVRQYCEVWDCEDEPPSPFHPYLIEKEDPWLCVDPRHVLVECGAKRRIVELAEGPINDLTWIAVGAETTDSGDTDVDQKVLRLLALPYAGHPDYQPEWKP